MKPEEKTTKYGLLRWELKRQFPEYDIRQYNIITDVLGGWSREVDEAMTELVRARGGEILLRMQSDRHEKSWQAVFRRPVLVFCETRHLVYSKPALCFAQVYIIPSLEKDFAIQPLRDSSRIQVVVQWNRHFTDPSHLSQGTPFITPQFTSP